MYKRQILDGTDATCSNAGFSLLTDTVVETNDTSSAITADLELLEEKEIVISLSDHEPVISTIYIKKWSEWWTLL